MFVLVLASWALSVLLSIPLLYLAFEVACGLKALRPDEIPDRGARSVILIPAHNEEGGIGATVRAVLAAKPRECTVLVVADNCNDRTAAAARDAGAEVVERHEPGRLGKGYALAFGRQHMRANPPDVVVVLDADCRLAAGSAERLIGRAMATGAPVQASNLVRSAPEAAALVQISNFAMLVKNLVRARGLQRIGGGSLLLGTGMAFPWSVFLAAPLATPDVVEDLRLGIALARAGLRARLEEGARVSSEAAALADTAGQRRRWEHGFLRAAAQNAIPLLIEGLRETSRHRMALGMHLLIPPLALLFLLGGVGAAGLSGAAAITGRAGPAIVMGLSLAAAASAVLIAWLTEGRTTLSARALLSVPFYAAWKLPIYAGFFIARQTGWNRTHRATDGASSETRS